MGRLLKVALWSLIAPLCCVVAYLLTNGAGPCGSMAGFYCFYAFLLFCTISALLLVIAFAQWIARKIPG
jgi:hypothetical protein